jgi:hypothetical protein
MLRKSPLAVGEFYHALFADDDKRGPLIVSMSLTLRQSFLRIPLVVAFWPARQRYCRVAPAFRR